MTEPTPERTPVGVAILLSALGQDAADDLARRLTAIGLSPAQAGILRAVAAEQGRSQQSISELLSVQPSRVVAHVDALQHKGWLERRRKKDDRRLYALYLTPAGAGLIRQLEQARHEHERTMTSALTADQAERLRELLTTMTEHRGLVPDVVAERRSLTKGQNTD